MEKVGKIKKVKINKFFLQKSDLNSKKSSSGITLIALIITIIVLLLLAGVTIATLTGDNGILSQAQSANTTSKIAEIEERANLQYTAMLIDQLSGKTSENVALAAVCIELRDTYNLPVQLITTDAPTVDKVIFTSDNVTKSNEGTVGTISIEQGTAATTIVAEAVPTEATGNWYAIVEGKHYKINLPSGQNRIEIERTETDVSGENNTPAVKYYTSNNPEVTVGENTGVISVSNNATGTATITAEAGGKSATCTVTVLKYVTVTITAETGGTLGSGTSANGSYLEGASINLVATASEGYKFTGWEQTVNNGTTENTTSAGTNASITYEVPNNATSVVLKAKFVKEITVGSEVTIGDEHFYVIKKEGTTVTLISKYNLATSTNSEGKYYQQNADYGITSRGFSRSNYWSDDWKAASGTARRINLNTWDAPANKTMPSTETLGNNAVLKARKYGQDLGGTGRLLTYEEANTSDSVNCLFGMTSSDPLRTVLYGRYTGDDKVGGSSGNGYLMYWLASTYETWNGSVWYVYGNGSSLSSGSSGSSDGRWRSPSYRNR